MTGIETYPVDRLYEEVAFIAYHFHWDREEILQLPHEERQRWCEEISKINERINEESREAGGSGPGRGGPGAGGGNVPEAMRQSEASGPVLTQDISDWMEE